MSDWDFLHDMHDQGYSPDQIADAASCGYNPWEFDPDEWLEIPKKELRKLTSNDDPELACIFKSLVENALSYRNLTGRYLQIWGELGELYAEMKYGIKLHKPNTPGSDGRVGNDFIEIKTISPEKGIDQVQVKRAGNFNKLLVVKINEKLEFEGRFMKRKHLSKGEGKYARVSWSKLSS